MYEALETRKLGEKLDETNSNLLLLNKTNESISKLEKTIQNSIEATEKYNAKMRILTYCLLGVGILQAVLIALQII